GEQLRDALARGAELGAAGCGKRPIRAVDCIHGVRRIRAVGGSRGLRPIRTVRGAGRGCAVRRVHARHHVVATPPSIAGECMRFKTLPLPMNMWTPHGRHGSKLRTERMMSMPLKRSGGFSSKIGVFCTASS